VANASNLDLTACIQAQRLVGFWAKELGKVVRLDLPEHDVGICHGKRTSAAVACQAWIGSGAFPADAREPSNSRMDP